MRQRLSDLIEFVGLVAVGVGAVRLNTDVGIVVSGGLAVGYAYLLGRDG